MGARLLLQLLKALAVRWVGYVTKQRIDRGQAMTVPELARSLDAISFEPEAYLALPFVGVWRSNAMTHLDRVLGKLFVSLCGRTRACEGGKGCRKNKTWKTSHHEA